MSPFGRVLNERLSQNIVTWSTYHVSDDSKRKEKSNWKPIDQHLLGFLFILLLEAFETGKMEIGDVFLVEKQKTIYRLYVFY